MLNKNAHYGPQTRAIHAGETPDPVTHASAPSIAMSTTYVVSDASAQFSANALGEEAPFVYCRWGNPTVRQLELKLADLEGGEAAVAFASGMAAATALFVHRLSAGDHLVVSDVAYAGVSELVRQTLPRLGIEVQAVDLTDTAALARALRPTTKLVYAETPANPILKLTDIRAVAELVHQAGAELAVDSTFASPVATRPLELGADVVLHSLTKYLCGHGDAVGGALVGRSEAMRLLTQDAGIHLGGILSPFNAWLTMRGMATLPLRMRVHAENAMKVAEFLEQHPRVTRVIYPGLKSHPQHELARRQMQNFSGMLTFQVPDGRATAQRFADRLAVIHYAVSLGHHRSLIFYMPTEEMQSNSFHLDEAQMKVYRQYAGDGIFRLSVGLEDPEDLCADLDQALRPA
ncbi:MAG TPA: aminotransferase class I/II-fold pyridoxal phosphate-dependent enzyme [Polyangiaceae bacterium]|nr:aminotransferase class I/II-fold pyridoxal phosphate-dependent enzyme [Polyangiaceae bacterium]